MLSAIRSVTAILGALILLAGIYGSQNTSAGSLDSTTNSVARRDGPRNDTKQWTPTPPHKPHVRKIIKEIDISPEQRQWLLEPTALGHAEHLAQFAAKYREYVRLHTALMELDAAIEEHCGDCRHPPHNSLDVAQCCAESSGPVFSTTLLHTFLRRVEANLVPWAHHSFSSVSHLYKTFASAPRTRGIVLTTGRGLQARMAMVSIRTIRASGCTLPIEVMYAGDWDLDPVSRSRIEAMGNGYDIVTRDLTKIVDPTTAGLLGWSAKPFSAMYASFSEVILQDADVVWVGSPEEVFLEDAYKNTGTLFYFDRRRLTPSEDKRFYFVVSLLSPDLMRLPSPEENVILRRASNDLQESGVVAIDKSRQPNFYGLLAACALNDARWQYITYDHVYGDKETFWLGWEMAGFRSFGWTKWPAAAMGYIVRGTQSPYKVIFSNDYSASSTPDGPANHRRICAVHLTHLDRTGTRVLWFNGGPLRDKYQPDSKPLTADDLVWAAEGAMSYWESGEQDSILCLAITDDKVEMSSTDGRSKGEAIVQTGRGIDGSPKSLSAEEGRALADLKEDESGRTAF
ncbi:glycosyltransferase family 71 protein [Gonapodya prolifera JEL478]|uniref:Glycosyltransferase family 71 protein n=1 Tax=Gonapodya prolifera (strain JEL478) TaxID=1344416 RepID=A0A139A4K1_GONPJ|nr:glycosyltransferase family 71 protein [Gonapodya prolifera JEL478]|eukprot:KXS11721.1 glycosyltransferase family 71 protein [Gonapodya prolifera JEL478]